NMTKLSPGGGIGSAQVVTARAGPRDLDEVAQPLHHGLMDHPRGEEKQSEASDHDCGKDACGHAHDRIDRFEHGRMSLLGAEDSIDLSKREHPRGHSNEDQRDENAMAENETGPKGEHESAKE